MASERPVRVVIVNYNAGGLLTECVARVAASTHPVDIVVVDNASTDGSIDLLRRSMPVRSGLTILENPANLGFARANNLALRDWPGEFALLLNPDCLIEADTLAGMLAALRGEPHAGLAGCLILNSDGTEQSGCRRLVPTPGQVLRRACGGRGYDLAGTPLPDGPIPVEAISGAFMLVRMTAATEVGPLDEDYFMHWEDLDWCQRFRQAGWRILFVPGLTVTHRKGVCSTSAPLRVEWHKHRGMLRFFRKFFLVGPYLPIYGLLALAVWARFAARAALIRLRRS
jgi:hypothetical protein